MSDALIWAVEYGRLEATRVLIAHGADPNAALHKLSSSFLVVSSHILLDSSDDWSYKLSYNTEYPPVSNTNWWDYIQIAGDLIGAGGEISVEDVDKFAVFTSLIKDVKHDDEQIKLARDRIVAAIIAAELRRT